MNLDQEFEGYDRADLLEEIRELRIKISKLKSQRKKSKMIRRLTKK